MNLDVLEFANQIRKLGLSAEEVVGIANALAASELPVKDQSSKAHLFPYQFYRFLVLDNFDKHARKAPEAVGSSCQSAFIAWRDKLAGLPAKPKSPKS